MSKETHIIDATNQPIGRLASRVVQILMGKHKPNFDPSKDMGDIVIVKNIKKVKITGKKFKEKKYYSHSGYLGGLKVRSFQERFEKDPIKLFREIVAGMLPKNKLRKKRLKKLIVE
jgi:large subunit ribosomal protein L13